MASATSIVVGSPPFHIGERVDFASADSPKGTSHLRMTDCIPHSCECPPPGVLTGVRLTPPAEAPGRDLALVESEEEDGGARPATGGGGPAEGARPGRDPGLRLSGLGWLATSWLDSTCIARHLGGAAVLLGDYEKARELYQQAAEVSETIGNGRRSPSHGSSSQSCAGTLPRGAGRGPGPPRLRHRRVPGHEDAALPGAGVAPPRHPQGLTQGHRSSLPRAPCPPCLRSGPATPLQAGRLKRALRKGDPLTSYGGSPVDGISKRKSFRSRVQSHMKIPQKALRAH